MKLSKQKVVGKTPKDLKKIMIDTKSKKSTSEIVQEMRSGQQRTYNQALDDVARKMKNSVLFDGELWILWDEFKQMLKEMKDENKR